MKNIEVFVGNSFVLVPSDFGCSLKHVINKFGIPCGNVDIIDGIDENDNTIVTIETPRTRIVNTRRFNNAVRRFNSKFINKYGVAIHFEVA